MALKTQQSDEKRKVIRIPYPNQCDAHMMETITNDLIHMLKVNSSNKEAFNDILFELVPRPQTPLTVDDYLVDKRPPLRLLT